MHNMSDKLVILLCQCLINTRHPAILWVQLHEPLIWIGSAILHTPLLEESRDLNKVRCCIWGHTCLLGSSFIQAMKASLLQY